MIRLFVAIPVPHDPALALAGLAEGVPGARWSPAKNLHITLRFVGDVAETLAEDLDSALSSVHAAPFGLGVAGVGSFGDNLGVQAIWAGVEANDALTVLRGRCESAARRAGLKPDTRTWKPHVTLAYLSGSEPARVATWNRDHSLLKLPAFTVDGFGLYSSWKTRNGSAYRLERFYRLRSWPRGPSEPPAS